jgi:putative ABC transport system permease protein
MTRHPWQIVLSILGIALGVAVVVSIDLANQSASRAFELSLESVAGRSTHHIVGGPAGLPDSLYQIVRVQEGYRRSAPVVEGHVTVRREESRTFTLLGIDPFAERPFRSFSNDLIDASPQLFSLLMTRPESILLTESAATDIGISPGDTLSIISGVNTKVADVIGLIEPGDERSRYALDNIMVADISSAQELLDMQGRLSRIDLIIEDTAEGKTVLERFKRALPPGARIEESNLRSQTAEQMVRGFELNLTALSLLALIVGTFLIYNTMTFSVLQRRTHIGLQRSIGVTRREIFTLILGEAFILGIIGTIIGIFIGILLGKGMVKLVTQSINDLYYVLNVRSLQISGWSLVKGFLLGMGATFFAALKPAREATSAPPRVVLSRSHIESEIKRKIPAITLSALLLSVAGFAILLIPGKSIWMSFAGLIPLILGLALFTPLLMVALTAILNKILGRIAGTLGSMASRGVVSQMSRTAVAIAALSIAVATTIGVGTMVNSFRGTVVSWLGNILSADIYIAAPRLIATQANGDIDFEFSERLAGLSQAKHVNFYREIQLETAEGPKVLFIAKIGAHRYDNFTFKSGDPKTAWPAYQDDEAALISETYAYRYDTEVGSYVTLTTDAGEKKFKVAGIYYDYGTDIGIVSLSYKTYRKYWNDDKLSGVLVYAHDGTDIDALMKEIRSLTDPDDQLIIQSNKSLMTASIAVFDRTFLITRVLQSLAIIVAFIGVLSALMAIQLERIREFGILRANGLTPRQLWAMVVLQTGVMGFIAGLLSIPIGNIIAWVLIHVINLRSFGWTIHFQFMPDLVLQAMLLALFAAILAGIYPAFKLANTSPALALREE